MTDLRKAAEMALEALKISTPVYSPHKFTQALKALEAALAQSDNQEPVAHLWECIGRWSSYLALNGEKANLAPPEWLVDAVKAATAQGEQDISYTDIQMAELIMSDCGHSSDYTPLLNRIAGRLATYRQALAQPEQESKPMYVMGNYAGEGKVVSASFGLPKGAFESAPHTGKGEASKIKHSLEPMPEQAVVSFPSFMRKRIEQALKDTINPKGMSVHDGKVKVLVGDLHRMLLVIDSASPRKEWVGLTDDEVNLIYAEPQTHVGQYAKAIEAALRSKNEY